MPTRPVTKAIALSALVYPGAGQLYLKRWVMAAVLIVIASGALAVLLIEAVTIGNALAARIVSGELQLGPGLLAEVSHATAAASTSSTPATVALAAAWLIGIVHAWFAARQTPTPRSG